VSSLDAEDRELMLRFLHERWDEGGRDIQGWEKAVKPILDKYYPHADGQPRYYGTPVWPVVVCLLGLWVPFLLGTWFGSQGYGKTFFVLLWLICTGVIYFCSRSIAEQRNQPYVRWSAIESQRSKIASEFVREAQSMLGQFIRDDAERKRLKAAEEFERRQVRGLGPIQECTPRQAERLAALWMQHMGESDAVVSQATRDGGIDVESSNFVAEVKHHAKPVGPVPVRSLHGVAMSRGKVGVFFSRRGYTASSVEFARDAGLLLFTYNPEAGTLRGLTKVSEYALENGLSSVLRRVSESE